MKTKILLFTLLIIGLSFASFGQTQNPIWSLPNHYLDFDYYALQSLPTGTTGYPHYNNEPVDNCSNAIQDANGDLLFFIVDGKIYNNDGNLMAVMDNLGNNNASSSNIAGNSELPIVQNPENCRQYFIFSLSTFHNNWGGTQNKTSSCYYSVYDLDAPNSNGLIGDLIVNGQLMTYYPALNPAFTGANAQCTYWGISKLRDINTDPNRFIFINRPSIIDILKLDAQGLSGVNEFILPTPQDMEEITFTIENLSRSEMEIYEMTNGNYRVALSRSLQTKLVVDPNSIPQRVLTIFEISHDGQTLTPNSLQNYFFPISSTNEDPAIHGIEFSPNGRYVYFTKQDYSIFGPAPQYFIQYVDYDNQTLNTLSQIPSSEASDFQNSQIELAKDGKLYLITYNRMATIDVPNSPQSTTWTNNAVSINYSISNPGSSSMSGLYLLPDQIDGMNYQVNAPSLPYYQVVNHTAQTSGTWQNGQNQNPWGLTNMEVVITDELIIPNNVNLIIKDMTLHFAPDAKVIIKPGGKLTLDGSTFTNNFFSCNNSPSDFWKGVQVWGTSSQHQYPSQNPTYQGMLVLKNGGTIEYAREAAQNWKPNDYNKIGGVIQSYGGKFINNRKDVGFATYQNFTPGNPSNKQNDLSAFNDTKFISDNNYIELTGDVPLVHVSMWDVHGVSFNGCTFANNKTGSKLNSATPKKGIYSVDASFTVNTFCTSGISPCPTGNVQKSSFSGLFTAIEADGAGTSETVKVTQSEFNDIVNGVLINEIDNVSIDRNSMVLNDPGYNPFPTISMQQIGVQIKNSTGFIVEENNISADYSFFSPNTPNSYGIVINNSGTAENRVYKNILSSLRVASSGYAINYGYSPIYGYRGLQFLCNTYSENKFDIYVGDISGVTDGIRMVQGSFSLSTGLTISAENTFSDIKPLFGNWNLNNNNGISMFYFYSPFDPNTEPINSNGDYTNVTKDYAKVPNACPSSFGGGIIFQPFSSLSEENDSLENVYNNLNYNYRSLIDGGNTQQLQQAIDNSWSDDVWSLRNQLIEKSPYLSTSTLLKVAEQQDLPDAMLLEVLLANPDATRSSDFIEKLKEATHYSFPQYMINYVKDNRSTETTRTILEGQMSGVQTEIALNQSILKHKGKMRDSFNLAERESTVEMGSSIFDKVGRVDYYIGQEQWSDAQSVINGIKNNDTLKDQQDFIKHFSDYINFRENLGERKLDQLNSSEIQQLKTWAEEEGRVAGYAQNILCFFYNTCYSDSLTVDESGGSSSNTSNSTPINDVLYNLSISPNPATSNTTIQWTIYDELENCSYKIQNINDGSVVAQGSITQNEGSATINVSQLLNGYYVVKIINNGKVKVDKKLVIE